MIVFYLNRKFKIVLILLKITTAVFFYSLLNYIEVKKISLKTKVYLIVIYKLLVWISLVFCSLTALHRSIKRSVFC